MNRKPFFYYVAMILALCSLLFSLACILNLWAESHELELFDQRICVPSVAVSTICGIVFIGFGSLRKETPGRIRKVCWIALIPGIIATVWVIVFSVFLLFFMVGISK